MYPHAGEQAMACLPLSSPMLGRMQACIHLLCCWPCLGAGLLPTFLPVFSAAGPMLPRPTLPPLVFTPPTTSSIAGSHSQLYGESVSASLPPKLVKRILDLEYIDMADLVPESWRLQEESENGKCCHQHKRPRRGPVTDILLWVDCYATLVGVLVEQFPNKAGEFMAYLRTILRAHRTFAGETWVSYDMSYRRKAANLKSLDWGTLDSLLFHEAFAGRAKAVPRCRYCLSELHTSQDCDYAPTIEEKPKGRLSRSQGTSEKSVRPTVQLCLLFNSKAGNTCRYKSCKFAHLCALCHGAHPVADCRKEQGKA